MAGTPSSSNLQPETTVQPQFGLPTLFYLTALVAAAVGLLGPWGIFWALAVVLFWWLKTNQTLTLDCSGWIIMFVFGGCLVGMLLPSVSTPSHVAYRSANLNNLRQLGLAIHNYESAHRHFPPAYIADENGKPMHSWRVLILPFIEEQAVYDQYDFDEPWNGPNNSKLVDQLSSSWSPYTSGYEVPNGGLTQFKLVVGPGTAFVDDQTTTFADIKAGSSNTIMMVHDRTKPVNWMSPEDITIEEAVKSFDAKLAEQDPSEPSLDHVVENKFSKTTYYYHNVGLFDGSVQTGGSLKDPSVMREHFTIENPPETYFDDLRFDGPYANHETKPEGYILLAANFILAVLPRFWFRRKKQGYPPVDTLPPGGSSQRLGEG